MRSFRNEMFNFRNLNLEMKKFVKIVFENVKFLARLVHIVLSIPMAFVMFLGMLCLTPLHLMCNKMVEDQFERIMNEL